MSAKRAALALLLAAASGCGPDADAYPFVRPEAEEPDPTALRDEDRGPQNFIEDDRLEDWDLTGAGPLTGIFAVEVVAKAKVIVDLEFRQLLRLRLLQHGRRVRVKSQLCRLSLPTIQNLAELTIPLPTERVIRSKVDESEDEYLSSSTIEGAAFRPRAFRALVGAKLSDPSASLPTARDLSTALDEDNDGSPGVTLTAKVLVCERREKAYVALRTSALLAGIVQSADAFSGTLDVGLEQSVLGMSNPCLSAATDLKIEIQPGSTFRAVRVGAKQDIDENGNVVCGELVAAAEELFGEAWKKTP